MASGLLLSAGLLAVASSAVGEEPPSSGRDCAVQMAERIQTYYAGIRDLEATFEQSIRSVTLGSSALTGGGVRRGRVLLARPGRMRWSYEEPEPSLVVSDGKTMWIYDPSAKEVQRLPVDRGYLSGAGLQFLMGDGELLEEFSVTAERCSTEVVDLELVPKREASYERLGLRAIAASGEITDTRLVDLFGNETRLSFRDTRTNQNPAPERFRFVVPPDVVVIDLVPAP